MMICVTILVILDTMEYYRCKLDNVIFVHLYGSVVNHDLRTWLLVTGRVSTGSTPLASTSNETGTVIPGANDICVPCSPRNCSLWNTMPWCGLGAENNNNDGKYKGSQSKIINMIRYCTQ